MPAKSPWELVSSATYFRRVLGNFVKLGFGPAQDGKAHVRFGETGDGHSPLYQITNGTASATCFNGLNHKQNKSLPMTFAIVNLSKRSFNYSEVQTLLANCTHP